MISLLLSAALADTIAPGDPIDEAIGLHFTTDGLDQLGNIVERVIPEALPITDFAGSLSCSDSDTTPLSYALGDMELLLAINSFELDTTQGALDLALYMTLSSTESALDVTGDCTFLSGLEETCGVELPVTSAVARLGIDIALTEGVFEATTESIEFEISPIGNPLSDCVLADAIGTLLGQNENAISDILLGMITPELDGLNAEIDSALNEALNALNVDTSLSLGGSEIGLAIYPSALSLNENGLALGLGATVSADSLESCVRDPGEGSEALGGSWPMLGATAPDSNLPYDVGLLINRDFVDHLLWTVWAGGGLCLTLDNIDGVDVNTEFMGTFLDEEFQALFPERTPATVEILPGLPPIVNFYDEDPAIGVDVEDLFVELFAELEGRNTRIFQTAMGGEIGLDPGITSTMIAPELILDEGLFQLEERWSDLLGQGYAAGLSSFVETVLATGLIPTDLLPTMGLPDLMGAGIDGLFWIPTLDGQWLGGYLLVDTESVEPIVAPGCSGSEGLGCDGGSVGGGDIFGALGCGGSDTFGCGEGSTGCEDSSGSGCEDGGCSTTHDGRLPWPVGRAFLFGITMLAFRARRGGR